MENNKYRGQVPIKIGKKVYKIAFDYNALATISSKWQLQDLQKFLSGSDVEAVVNLLVIGLQKYHPDVDRSFIMENSPPYILVTRALDEALTYSYFGPQGAPNEYEVEPATEKKNKKTK